MIIIKLLFFFCASSLFYVSYLVFIGKEQLIFSQKLTKKEKIIAVLGFAFAGMMILYGVLLSK